MKPVGGSATNPVMAMDQASYLDHEIALLANLSAAQHHNILKAIFVYELYDEPAMFTTYANRTHACGEHQSRNGESCYGVVGMDWGAGSPCDQYPSCNFTVTARKPSWQVLHDWAQRLA